ncbi:MAG: hypothetical protein KatS3mg068_2330 [Candidatus Sericytochromatia bacterium]|nr:MAG: hypothetical protein KatS3mg068_2330 [Candidatus Sericytochromatia bacterium]
MDYILCTNDCWKKLHQDFWEDNFCKVCSNKDMCKKWARNDLYNDPNTKDRIVLAVGTSCKREKPLEKIDILIIGNKPAEGYVPPQSQFPYTDICGHIDNFYQDYLKRILNH